VPALRRDHLLLLLAARRQAYLYQLRPYGCLTICLIRSRERPATRAIVRQPNTPTVNVFQELLNIFK
jgi:hypothetical protein